MKIWIQELGIVFSAASAAWNRRRAEVSIGLQPNALPSIKVSEHAVLPSFTTGTERQRVYILHKLKAFFKDLSFADSAAVRADRLKA